MSSKGRGDYRWSIHRRPGAADDQQADAHLGEVVLDRAVAAYRAAFGSCLIAGDALGSLAHGGFSPLVSDVDLGLILGDPVGPEDQMTIDTVSRSVRAGGSALEQRLWAFGGAPATLQGRDRGGRFPPLDRLDLLEYGRRLTGTDVRSAVARPDRTELLVAGAEFALGYLGDDVLTEIRTPSRLVSRGPRRVTKIVLFPVRFLFTAETGQVGTNSSAARHYLASPDAAATSPVTAALAWRLEPPADDVANALVKPGANPAVPPLRR